MVDVEDYNVQITNSIVHNLSYVSKVLLSIFMLLFIVIADSSMDLYMINILILVIFAWSNINTRIVIKNIGFFGVFIFLLLFFISVIFLNLYLGLFWIIKIIDVIVLLTIIGMTTSFYGLVVGTKSIFKFLDSIIDVNRLSINIASILKFMSILYSERNRINNSKRFRGVKFELMDFVDKIDFLLREMGLVIMFTRKKIDKLKRNIYNNKYGTINCKGINRLNKWKKTDTILLIINVLMFFIIIIY